MRRRYPEVGRRAHEDDPYAHHVQSKIYAIKVYAHDGALSAGDGATYEAIPSYLNGMKLVCAEAHVFTASSSGTVSVMIHNYTDTVDMLSSTIDIAASAKHTTTTAVDTDNNTVATGDEIRVDIDGAGTGSKGLMLFLTFKRYS